MRRLSAFVVDDDPADLRLARKWLERAGYFVETRDQALGSLERIIECQPDVVLLDIVMPALQGPTLAQLLRKHGVTAPIILMAGESAEDLAPFARIAGVVGSIRKGAGAALFVHEVERLAGRSSTSGSFARTPSGTLTTVAPESGAVSKFSQNRVPTRRSSGRT